METAIFEHSEENIGEEYKNDDNVQVFTYEEQTESTESAWSDICRVCANSNDHIIPIFEAEGAEHELSDKIHCYLPIQVSKTDTLPIQLCYHCAATILAWHELISGCLDAEKQLLQMQSDRDTKESTDAKNPEDLSEELVDDPEPLSNDKQQESGSIDRREEEPERCNLGEEATKRSQELYSERMDSMTMKLEDESEIVIYEDDEKYIFCEQCDCRFIEISELLEHMRNVHEHEKRIEQCQYCEIIFDCFENFNEHMKIHASEERAIRNNDESFRNSTNIHELRSESEEKSSLSIIRETSDEKNVDATPETREEKKIIDRAIIKNGQIFEYHCEICDAILPASRINFLRHLRNHWEYDRYRCDTCKKTFIMEYALFEHQRKESHFANICTKPPSDDNSINDEATIRNERTNDETRKSSYMCEFCGKTYALLTSVRAHQRQAHASLNLHMCDMCERNFTTKLSLDNHRSSQHIRERPYACDYCEKKFSTPNAMSVHRRVHANPKPHACTRCEKRFSTWQRLSEHLSIHENIPFVCEKCGKSFAMKRNLMRHLRVHTSIRKTFLCKFCPSKFRQKRYLTVHMQIRHPDESMEPTTT